MYEILKITKKKNSNYNLYIRDYKDEKIEIHLEILYSYNLYSKNEINDDDFEEMLLENEKKLAKQQALKILSASNKTKKELITKLNQKKFSQDSIEYAMSFVDKYEFIDEESIAERLVDGKYKKKKYSKRRMQNELKHKGIDNDIIQDLISDIDDDDEYENAMHFAQKKFKTLCKKDREIVIRKLGFALSYRGFGYGIIRKVIDDIMLEYDEQY